jgi:hypothetical protein
VISRAPRPRVAKLMDQRMRTRSRFWKPTTYRLPPKCRAPGSDRCIQSDRLVLEETQHGPIHPLTNCCQPTKAGSSVASPGCRRFSSRDDTTAIVTPRVALSSEGPTRPAGRAHKRAHNRRCTRARRYKEEELEEAESLLIGLKTARGRALGSRSRRFRHPFG